MQEVEPYGGTSEAPMNYTTFMDAPPSQTFGSDPVGSGAPAQGGGLFLDPNYFDDRPSQGFTAPYATGEAMGSYAGVPYGASPETAPFSTRPPFMEDIPPFGAPGDSTDTSGIYSSKKGRHKSARQQQLNKLAQQRYRYVSFGMQRVKNWCQGTQEGQSIGLGADSQRLDRAIAAIDERQAREDGFGRKESGIGEKVD